MPIDLNLYARVEEVRLRVRQFMEAEVRPVEEKLQQDEADLNAYLQAIRGAARESARGGALDRR